MALNKKQKADRRKEFRENRTSWKWFERRAEISVRFRQHGADENARLEFLLQLEILKELQFLNDKQR